MKIYHLITFIVFNLFLIVKSQNDLKDKINSFTFRYLNQIKKVDPGNIVFSPLCIYSILSILSTVADRNTENEIRDLLNTQNMDQNSINDSFLKILDEIKEYQKNSKSANIKFSSLFFFNESVEINDAVSKYASKYFYTDFLKINSAKDSNYIRNFINFFLFDSTNDRLKNFLDNIAFNLFEIFNVNYFIDKALYPFKKGNNLTFNNQNNKTTSISTIQSVNKYKYRKEDKFETLKIDLQSSASLYFLLPKQDVHIDDLLDELPSLNIENVLGNLRKEHIVVTFPSIKIKKDHNLSKFLPSVGIKNLMENNQFKNLSKTENFYLNRINQYNLIDFKDLTKYTVQTKLAKSPFKLFPIDFTLNRPFIFMLKIVNVTVMTGLIKDI